MSEPKITMTARIDPKTFKQLKALAEKKGNSFQATIEQAFREMIERERAQA